MAFRPIQYLDSDAQRFYDAVSTWGPREDVPAGLSKVAHEIPLVILSNAADAQIQNNVAKLGAPFHRVYKRSIDDLAKGNA